MLMMAVDIEHLSMLYKLGFISYGISGRASGHSHVIRSRMIVFLSLRNVVVHIFLTVLCPSHLL